MMLDVRVKGGQTVRVTDIVATTRLDARSRLTLPDAIVRASGVEAGSTVLVEFDPSDCDVVRLRLVRSSYAGRLNGMYGPVADYVDGEREAWNRT